MVRLYIIGVSILLVAIICNIIVSKLGIVSWYDFLENITKIIFLDFSISIKYDTQIFLNKIADYFSTKFSTNGFLSFKEASRSLERSVSESILTLPLGSLSFFTLRIGFSSIHPHSLKAIPNKDDAAAK